MGGSIFYKEIDNIGIIEIDQPDSKVNTLTTELMKELEGVIYGISGSKIEGLIIASRKKDVFIAGADIKEIEGITNFVEARSKSKEGQAILNKLENLDIPTLAAINGAALGGGLELALACRYRIAVSSEKTRLGLPEVALGIIPGFGGTKRLVRLVGIMKALDMILPGKAISYRDALRAGLVDKVVYGKLLFDEALTFIKDINTKKWLRRSKKRKLLNLFLENTAPGRAALFSKAKKNVLKNTKGHYPAPLIALDVIRRCRRLSLKDSLDVESTEFAKLAITGISKNLIKVFYLSQEYKKLTGVEPKIIKPLSIKKCGVLGAGVMGGGIAQLVSFHDIPVKMKDLNYDAIGKGLSSAYKVYKGAVSKRILNKNEAAFRMGLISGATTYSGFKKVDIVIEAVVENLDIKKRVFKEVSGVVSDSAILASNTSALSITEMSRVSKNPRNVIGMHFFNPVHRMPLIEIIKGEYTSDETVAATVEFSKRLGKVPIIVNDTRGFLVNRILLPYINEAAIMLEEGISVEAIDRSAEVFGMPMGPLTLIDEIGIDIGYKVAKILEEAFGERMRVSQIFDLANKNGLYGKKTGKGFYVHRKKKRIVNSEINGLLGQIKPENVKSHTGEDAIRDRMFLLMINEASRCLQEGVCLRPSDVDVGMIFGTGFPPFRGGLLRYADKAGIQKIADTLNVFSKDHGEKYAPSKLILELAKSGKSFYS